MNTLKLSDLLSDVDCFQLKNVDLQSNVSYLSCDSRDIPSDGTPIFFAIKGNHVDANCLIDDVLKKNVHALIVSENEQLSRGIVVKNLFKCIAQMAKRFHRKPDERLNVLAITGTNGKTTISFLLRHLLNSVSKTGLIGTIEYDLGEDNHIEAINTTPLALDFYKFLDICMKNKCRNIVLEASSHAIDQYRIYGLQVDVAVFSNLSQEHLDYHRTLDQYFLTKAKLFDGQNGTFPKVSLVNIDDPYGQRLLDRLINLGYKVLSFGESSSADFRIVDITNNQLQGATFGIQYEGTKFYFKTHLIGRHNISNITASVAAAHCLGLNFYEMQEKILNFYGVPGRLEKILLKNGATVFIDFAHTPAALKTILNVLHPCTEGRLITVFGCGGDRDRSKRAPMMSIVSSLSDLSIATSDNPRSEEQGQIFSDMKEGITSGSLVEFIEDRRDAIKKAIQESKIGDVILFAGRGHENLQKIGDDTIHFNDREVVEEINELI